jgi:ubiquinone/menaquinone biosynthesis C-methylase UbiE
LIPPDGIVHAELQEPLSRVARGGAQLLIALYASLRRKSRVVAQYNTDRLASDYAYAHSLSRPEGRHLRCRIRVLHELLTDIPYGNLLDAGCGPGILTRSLLDSPRHDYNITVLDQSQAMVRYCKESTRDTGKIHAAVGDLETLPFADGAFDITIVTGALEYTDARVALRQISRVTRDGGVVILSMLNPKSPYRLTEWFVYWPALRMFAAAMKSLHIRTKRPHGANLTGIRALTAAKFRRYAREAGLNPVDLLYFDMTPLVPPLDRLPVLIRWAERRSLKSGATRGWGRLLAPGYVLISQRTPGGAP